MRKSRPPPQFPREAASAAASPSEAAGRPKESPKAAAVEAAASKAEVYGATGGPRALADLQAPKGVGAICMACTDLTNCDGHVACTDFGRAARLCEPRCPHGICRIHEVLGPHGIRRPYAFVDHMACGDLA